MGPRRSTNRCLPSSPIEFSVSSLSSILMTRLPELGLGRRWPARAGIATLRGQCAGLQHRGFVEKTRTDLPCATNNKARAPLEVGMEMRGRATIRRALVLSVMTVATVLVVAAPASAAKEASPAKPEVEHCVASVVDQAADGELILGSEACYATFSEAMSAASDGKAELPLDTAAVAVFGDELVGTLAVTFTLGIHFDGYNGSGSSISITGTSCSGGYWNATGWWRNRISSSFNGCYHLRHYDNPSKSGSYYNTYGGGQIDNMASWFNNRTESVAYYSW